MSRWKGDFMPLWHKLFTSPSEGQGPASRGQEAKGARVRARRSPLPGRDSACGGQRLLSLGPSGAATRDFISWCDAYF